MGDNILPVNMSDMWETFNNDFVKNVSDICFLFKPVHPIGFLKIIKKKSSIPKFSDEELPLIFYLNKILEIDYLIKDISCMI